MEEKFGLSDLNIPRIIGVGLLVLVVIILLVFIVIPVFLGVDFFVPQTENSFNSFNEKEASEKNNQLEINQENSVIEENELEPFTFKIRIKENQEFSFWVDDATEMSVKWGEDRKWESISEGTGLVINKYDKAGEYFVSLKGYATRISFGVNKATPFLLRDILTPISNSVVGLNSAKQMFRGINVNEFSSKNFFDETSSGIIDMEGMFELSKFNQDISSWNVSNVDNMINMFSKSEFNQPIGDWNVSSVRYMMGMFNESKFNQNINAWDTNNLIDCSDIFKESLIKEEYKPVFVKCKSN